MMNVKTLERARVLMLFLLVCGLQAQAADAISAVASSNGWYFAEQISKCPAIAEREVEIDGVRLRVTDLDGSCIGSGDSNEPFYFLEGKILHVTTYRVRVVKAQRYDRASDIVVLHLLVAPVLDDGRVSALAGAVCSLYYLVPTRGAGFKVRKEQQDLPELPAWVRSQTEPVPAINSVRPAIGRSTSELPSCGWRRRASRRPRSASRCRPSAVENEVAAQ